MIPFWFRRALACYNALSKPNHGEVPHQCRPWNNCIRISPYRTKSTISRVAAERSGPLRLAHRQGYNHFQSLYRTSGISDMPYRSAAADIALLSCLFIVISRRSLESLANSAQLAESSSLETRGLLVLTSPLVASVASF